MAEPDSGPEAGRETDAGEHYDAGETFHK
jgi:hypothetical protein